MAEQTSQQSSRTFDVFGRKVDTDKLVQLLSDRDAFDAYYKNKKISDSEREDTWRSLNILRKHLTDGTGGLQVVIDNNGYEGINNTAGLHNLDKKGRVKKGADAYATSYFLRLAKGMDAYEEPKKETDKSKIKYSDSAIGTALNRYIYGRDNGDIQDFLDQDKYDKDKKTRANTNRAALFRKGLQHVKDNWDTLFEGWTEDQKTNALRNIDNAFTVFDNDHAITDDEYLTLGKATGMTNLRKMFANGEVAVTQQDGSVVPVDQVVPRQRTYGDKIRWIEKKYKPYTGKLRPALSIAVPDTEVYENAATNTISTGFQNASNDELYSLIREGLTGADLNNNALLKKLFPNSNPRMSSHYLTNAALEQLKTRTDGLHNFGESNLGMYYIPTTKTDNNTGIVWNSNDKTLNEMSIHSIPYWVQRINNEWDALGDNYEEGLNPSLTSVYKNKSGGVLKAQRGAVMSRLGIPNKKSWLSIENTAANAANINTWDNYYDNSGIDDNIKTAAAWRSQYAKPKLADDDPNATLVRQLNFMDINNGNYSQAQLDAQLEPDVDKFWNYGYRVDDQGHPVKGQNGQLHGITGAQLGLYLNELEKLGSGLSWDKNVNGSGYDAWNRKFDQTGLNMYFGGNSDKFDYMGPSTYNRHAALERLKGTYNSKDNYLNIGNDKIYWNGNRWDLLMEPIKGEIPAIKTEIKLPEKLSLSQSAITNNEKNDQVVELDEVKDKVVDNSRLGGKDPKEKGNSSDTWSRLGQAALDMTPDLIGAGRLFDSLHTNNKVAETILPSLNPVLKNTYERYSPITGAFSERQFRNRQGASVLLQASRPFTSDASLASARMLDGQRQANELQYQGFLADDREVQRTKGEALARTEDNMARRSDIRNFNHASINQTNRERAQLEATRLKSNWQSRDNFLSGVEQRMRTKIEENRYNKNAFELGLAEDQANDLLTQAGKINQDAYERWLAYTDKDGKQPNKGKLISEWGGYEAAQDLLQEARNRGTALRRATQARLYNGRYSDPYNGDYSLPALRWSMEKAKNGTKLIPKKRK